MPPMDTPPPPPPQDAPPTSPPASGVDATERQWALGIHLSALLGFAGPHLLNVIGPLIIWLIKKQDSPYLDAVGKRVLNFQLSYSLYGFAAITLFGLLWWLVIGFIFLPIYAVVGVAWLVLTIIGAVKESNGETYDYPSSSSSFSEERCSGGVPTACKPFREACCVLRVRAALDVCRFSGNLLPHLGAYWFRHEVRCQARMPRMIRWPR